MESNPVITERGRRPPSVRKPRTPLEESERNKFNTRIAKLVQSSKKRKEDRANRKSLSFKKTSRPVTPLTRPASTQRQTQSTHRHTSSTDYRQPSTKRQHRRNQSMETVKKELKYGHRTNVGFMPGNPEKVNQDRFLCMTDFAGYANLSFFAVMDGHGYYGHFASELVKQKLPEHLSESSNLLVDNSTALTNAVTKTAEDMADASFDVNFSGTTLISCLVTPRKVWCANVGDSRALMGRLLKDSPYEVVKQRHWMSIALSRDHKPNEIDECERITQFGGRIEAYQDEEGNPLGPSRVWLPDEDIPGLAMSRSIGDLVAASVGVSYEPEILEYAITPDDRFIVLGSDGIFEFITNEEVVKIVVPFWKSNDAQGACLALYKEAYARWIKEEEVIDDITAVVIFLP